MEKINNITPEQFESLREAYDPQEQLLELCGLPSQTEYGLGDTAVTIPNAELFGIYRQEWKGKTLYYLVVSVMSDELAFAWSLYPTA